MNWSSFSTGVFFGVSICATLWLTMPEAEPVWRQCAPAQDGKELVTTVQHPDRTDCFYQKRDRIKRHHANSKRTTS